MAFVYTQSVRGGVPGLDREHQNAVVWVVVVLHPVALCAWGSRAAVAAGEEETGLALTGAMMCVISPGHGGCTTWCGCCPR